MDGEVVMDRTLFSPSMIETYRACRRAYELASASFGQCAASRSVPSICRQFVRRGISEINRGKIVSANDVQTFMGKHWPLEMMEASGADGDLVARAFLFTYKILMNYAKSPYRPSGSEVVAIALKARSRVPHVRVYLEDTFDMILWYPARKHLEIVEYELRSKRTFSSAWPTVSALVKRFLCERLRVRWPFESVSLTTVKISSANLSVSSSVTNIEIDELIYKVHFEEINKDLEVMKRPMDAQELGRSCHKADEPCNYCQSIGKRQMKDSVIAEDFLSLSA